MYSIHSKHTHMKMVTKCFCLKAHANASKCVFKNTIKYIYVVEEPTSQHQSHSLFMVYTFKYEAIFVIVHAQVTKTTQYTTSNFLCSKQKVQTLILALKLQTVIYAKNIFTKFT